MGDLDGFLKGNEAEEVETPEAEPETPETPEMPETPEAPEAKAETQPRGPDGKFVSKGETKPEEPPAASSPEATPEPQLDHAALIGERRRRQEAEDRLRALEAQLQQQPKFQQPAEAPDVFADPDGYTRWVAQQAAQQAEAQAYERFQYQRIEMAAQQFAPTVPDYAEKVQVFEQMAQANPSLMQELYRAANPAEYAYNTAKTQIEINQYGGLEGLIKARVQEALKAQVPAPTPAPPVPDTLAVEQSARAPAAGHQPPSLEEILGG
jgi:hypothetical protein